MAQTRERLEFLHGDCREVLKQYESESFQACLADPPCGIGMMGAEWDRFKRDQFIEFIAECFTEVYRALVPGAHCFVWALPRTSHWTGMGLEDAGFEPREVVHHLFASGWPKGYNVAKGIDAKLGAAPKVVGKAQQNGAKSKQVVDLGNPKYAGGFNDPERTEYDLTEPSTPEARQWDGWNTALKPAVEHWWLVRKPFKGLVVDNVLTHGTGAVNIGACRVPRNPEETRVEIKSSGSDNFIADKNPYVCGGHPDGGYPSHVVLSHSHLCEQVGEERLCVEGCSVKALNEQSGYRPGGVTPAVRGPSGYFGCNGHEPESGGRHAGGPISRCFNVLPPEEPFYYCPKPSMSEKNDGLEHRATKRCPQRNGATRPVSVTEQEEGLVSVNRHNRSTEKQNHHFAVKPVRLLQHLLRLITPPGGRVIDPFMGSGTAGLACVHEGFCYTGIDSDLEYVQLARERVRGSGGLLAL